MFYVDYILFFLFMFYLFFLLVKHYNFVLKSPVQIKKINIISSSLISIIIIMFLIQQKVSL